MIDDNFIDKHPTIMLLILIVSMLFVMAIIGICLGIIASEQNWTNNQIVCCLLFYISTTLILGDEYG